MQSPEIRPKGAASLKTFSLQAGSPRSDFMPGIPNNQTDLPPPDELTATDAITQPGHDPASAAAAAPPVPRGAEAIRRYWEHAPVGPGVYRMIAANGEVLYVGKAKSVRKRIASYLRP